MPVRRLPPVTSLDRQRVLVAPTVEDRLGLVADLLADQELMIGARLDGG